MRQTKGKATKLQDHEGKTAQQWHNYACPQRSSARQQQISQLTLIIDNLKKQSIDTHNFNPVLLC